MAFGYFAENFARVIALPIVNILLLLVVVWAAGGVARKAKLPAVLGELLAGLIIGPAMLGWVGPSPELDILAKLGMFFLMFYAGLQTDPKKLFKARKKALCIGTLGTLFPFVFGFAAVLAFGGTLLQGVFVGAAISGTSMVTKSRILHDLKLLRTKFGYSIMGSAMVDNMLSFVIIAVAIRSAITGKFSILAAGITLVEASLFFILSILIGYKIYPHITQFMKQRTARGFTFALIVGLFFAFFAEMMRIHFIIGAYLAGLMVREEIAGAALFRRLKERFMVITSGFLGPLFIVSVAFKVSFPALAAGFPLFITVLLAAFVGKMLGAGIGAYASNSKKRDALTIGIGMNGRGTVGLILAFVGIELGIFNHTHLSILVLTAFITTLIVPFAIKYRMQNMSNHLLKE